MPPTSRDEFEIAIICALTLEADAVEASFDETYEASGRIYDKRPGDTNQYTNGRIGQHNVVLCCLPEMGVASAATVTANLKGSYHQIRLVLLVGICGAIPFRPGDFRKAEDSEIILGDVIVSDSVIQYDFGRQYTSGFKRKNGVKDSLGRPNTEIRAFLTKLKGRKTKRALHGRIQEHIKSLQSQDDIWKRPDSVHDVLFEASYHHMHYPQDPPTRCICSNHNNPNNVFICDQAIEGSCASIGCAGKLINRVRYGAKDGKPPATPKPAEDMKPLIHVGPMASANRVMRSGLCRDKLAKEEGVIGFEMEGAGAWDNGACVIIKGVCDYADSHKNKIWQEYAAAAAASCMKTLLELWMPRTKTQCQGLVGNAFAHCHNMQLRHRLENSPSMPIQVSQAEMVVMNDALGETFAFSCNMFESLEVFIMFLKCKFQHVGLGKIERREWMLQDHHTGRILDLTKHWKTIVMNDRHEYDIQRIIMCRQDLSTSCPWCKIENEPSLSDKYTRCQQCHRSYRCIEEIPNFNSRSSSVSSGARYKDPPWSRKASYDEYFIVPKAPWRERKDESDDIHLYTRVQIVDVRFQMGRWVSDNQISFPPSQGNTDYTRLDENLTPWRYVPAFPFKEPIVPHQHEVVTLDRNSFGLMDRKPVKCICPSCRKDGTSGRSAELRRHMENRHPGPTWYCGPSEERGHKFTWEDSLSPEEPM